MSDFKKDIYELIALAEEAIDAHNGETYDRFMEDLDVLSTRIRNFIRTME